ITYYLCLSVQVFFVYATSFSNSNHHSLRRTVQGSVSLFGKRLQSHGISNKEHRMSNNDLSNFDIYDSLFIIHYSYSFTMFTASSKSFLNGFLPSHPSGKINNLRSG